MDDTILGRWLNNTLTDEEREALEQHPDFPEFRRIAETAARLQPPDAETERVWPDMEKAVQSAIQPPARRTSRRWIWYSAAAAVAAIVVFIWAPWTKGPLLVQTGVGEEKTVNLPDGSLIKLNAVSELVVERAEWSERRRITLTGEAYFDVKNDPKAPFTVTTPHGKVTVLGTAFTVFSREKAYAVSCYRGLVQSEGNGQNIEVPEGRKINTNGDGNWLNSEVNEGDIPSWMRGESAFSNTALPEVVAELERQYGVTVELKTKEPKQFTGAFPNKNLNLALEILCKSLQLRSTTDGKRIVLEDE